MNEENPFQQSCYFSMYGMLCKDKGELVFLTTEAPSFALAWASAKVWAEHLDLELVSVAEPHHALN